MIFSVYDYDKRCFRYYDAVAGVPATGFFRKARAAPISGGFVPESFAAPLPADAKPIGEGPTPRGYIAEDPRGLSSLPLPGETRAALHFSWTNVPVWAVVVVAVASYLFGKRTGNKGGSL